MLLSLARRARGKSLILAFLFASLVAYYRPIHRFHIPAVSRTSQDYLNQTKEFLVSKTPGQISFSNPQNEVQFSCPEPICPPQLQCATEEPPSNLTASEACICPDMLSSASTSTESSISDSQSDLLDKATMEQETIAKLRKQGIVIIFKTGAQEVSQLAIHLGTTLRFLSPSDILFFSDLQGSIGPFIIKDALRNVDQMIRESNEDFEIYRKIHEYQSTGQDILELTEDRSRGDGRGGWRLDKYKFIHMVEETFETRPDARWYVFIETDSYIVWPNLVAWLSKLDSKKPWYMGSAVSTGAHSFAHGGSGYVLSNAAMNKLLGPDQPQGLARSWDTRMTAHCCGDIALGIALEEKGVKLTGARPYMNGYKPSTFTYGEHWCQPVVAMHHMTSHEISSMWRFERKRELMGIENATTFSELYEQFVEPQLTEEKDNWDNLSHGQEFKEPEGWIDNAEKEELRREEEARLREEKVKQLLEDLEKKKSAAEQAAKFNSPERLRQKLEELRKKRLEEKEKANSNNEEKMKNVPEKIEINTSEHATEMSNEEGKGNKEEGDNGERDGNGNNEMEDGKEEQANSETGDGDEVERPRFDPDSNDDAENKESNGLRTEDNLDRNDTNKGSKDSDPKVGNSAIQSEDSKPKKVNWLKEIKNKKTKSKLIQQGSENQGGLESQSQSEPGLDSEEPKPITNESESLPQSEPAVDSEEPEDNTNETQSQNDTDDSEVEEFSSDSEAPPVTDADTVPDAEPEVTEDLESDPESPSAAKPKRLIKRDDSLDHVDAGLNTHEKWRPVAPEKEAFKSFENCRKACAADKECFQFVHYEKTCKFSTSFRLGAYKAPVVDISEDGTVTRNVTFKSGWMMQRIRQWTEKNACKGPEWPVVEY